MRANFINMSKIKYNGVTVVELRALCKKRDIKGHYKMNKQELISALLESDNCAIKHCVDDSEFQPVIKKTKYKILNKLIESKKLIILSKIKDSDGKQILYDTNTHFVFTNIEDRKNKPENYIVIGFLTPELRVIQLTKNQILLCKEYNYEYHLPENISEKNDDENFENDELLSITNKFENCDDDEDENIPNYSELLI